MGQSGRCGKKWKDSGMDLMAWRLDGYLDFAIRSIVRGNVLHASLSKNWYEACNAERCMPDDVGLRETLLVLKALAVSTPLMAAYMAGHAV